MKRLLAAVIDHLPIRLVKSLSFLQWRFPWLRSMYQSVAGSYASRDGVIRRGAAKGLRFNPGQATSPGYLMGTYEPEIQRLYGSLIRPGMTVYDAGANVGFFAVLAARLVGPAGRVICFEPLPANIDAIRHNIALNRFENVTVIPQALGSQNAAAEFVVSNDVGWGRLASAGCPPEMKGRISVRVGSLATAIGEHNLPLPDLIKIDIEGGEVDMLEGSRDLLRQRRPVLLVELHATNDGVERILRESGYCSYVLGAGGSILEASWDAFVIAVASEDEGRREAASLLAKAARFGR